jgi:hypothetical protein
MRIQFRTVNFLNVDGQHLASRALLNFLPEAVDFRTLATDDNARPRGENGHLKLVAGALNFNRRHARSAKLVFEPLLKLQVFVEQVGVIFLGVPTRLPRFVVSQAEPKRMNFLTHPMPPSFRRRRCALSVPDRTLQPLFMLPALPPLR